MKRVAALLLLFAVAHQAGAAPIYRCGAVYQQTPCENGRVVEATDPRTAAQRAEAARVAAAERRRAAEMARERRINEASQQAPVSAAAASEPQVDHGSRGKRKVKVKNGPVKPLEPAGRRGRR
jgi:hypothetical protein